MEVLRRKKLLSSQEGQGGWHVIHEGAIAEVGILPNCSHWFITAQLKKMQSYKILFNRGQFLGLLDKFSK